MFYKVSNSINNKGKVIQLVKNGVTKTISGVFSSENSASLTCKYMNNNLLQQGRLYNPAIHSL